MHASCFCRSCGCWAADCPACLPRFLSALHACRAIQLFDWLRSLAPDSPQAGLCTPAVYCAMIGLFGQWRKPKQASPQGRAGCCAMRPDLCMPAVAAVPAALAVHAADVASALSCCSMPTLRLSTSQPAAYSPPACLPNAHCTAISWTVLPSLLTCTPSMPLLVPCPFFGCCGRRPSASLLS